MYLPSSYEKANGRLVMKAKRRKEMVSEQINFIVCLMRILFVSFGGLITSARIFYL